MGTQGTCLYGKLNYHLGKAKALRDGEAMFPNVDFCNDPGQVCAGLDSIPLRWISGMYHWMENVQKYDKGGFNYMNELVSYVNGNLKKEEFFEGAANIHVLGCHKTDCSLSKSLTDMDARLRAFEMVMSLFGLQFEPHAEPEPPFRAYPGQQLPTPAPTVTVLEETENTLLSPTSPPAVRNETVIIPFNVFLTGVPNATNMTNDEQKLFESVMFDMLVPRLETVDITVVEVVTDSQIPNPFVAKSSFDSQSESGAGGNETKPVLQVIMNVTISYGPPPPEGMRDWSIYLKSWIESFGNTMVEIFTSPKHPQHPRTNSKFWDELSDVSATNVEPPNTDPTMSPTPVPEPVWVYPDNSGNKGIIAGVTIFLLLSIVAFCVHFQRKLREHRQQNKKYLEIVDENSYYQPQEKKTRQISSESYRSRDSTYSTPDLRRPLERVIEESSSESSSSSDSDSSSDRDRAEKKRRPLAERKFTGLSQSQSVAASAAMRSRGSLASASSYSRKSSRDSDTNAASATRSRGSVAHASYYSQRSSRDSVTNASRSRGSLASASSYAKRGSRDSVANASTYSKSPSISVFANSTHGKDKSSMEDILGQFDEIVERVLVNDSTLNEIILDGMKKIEGRHYNSEVLWNALVRNSFVTRLSLRCCNFNDEGAKSLFLALLGNTYITHIWLGENLITDEAVKCEKNSFRIVILLLLPLHIFLTFLITQYYVDLMATLESNQSIVSVELTGNSRIGPALFDEIRSKLKPRENGFLVDVMERVKQNDPLLTTLCFSRMDIGSREDVLPMLDSLTASIYIRTLDLSWNEMDDDCVSYIALALEENTSVTYLNLANNSIHSDGAECKCAGLE
jgi:hypothetical protein